MNSARRRIQLSALLLTSLMVSGCGEPVSTVQRNSAPHQRPQPAGQPTSNAPRRGNHASPDLAPRPTYDAALRWQVAADPASVSPTDIQPHAIRNAFPLPLHDAQGIWFPPTQQPLAVVKRPDRKFEVFDLVTGKPTGNCLVRHDAPLRTAVSLDGQLLATVVSENGRQDLDVKGVQARGRGLSATHQFPPQYGDVNFMQFAGSSRIVLISRGEQRALVVVHELAGPPRQPRKFELWPNSQGEVIAGDDVAACSPGGRYLAAVLKTTDGSQLVVYELAEGKLVGALDVKNAIGEGQCEGVAFSHDGRSLALLVSHGPALRVSVYDVATGTQRSMASTTPSSPGGAAGYRSRRQDFPLRYLEVAQHGQHHRGWMAHGRHLFLDGQSSFTTLFPDSTDQTERLVISPDVVVTQRWEAGKPSLVLRTNLQLEVAAAPVAPPSATPAPDAPVPMELPMPAPAPAPNPVPAVNQAPVVEPVVSAAELAKSREFPVAPLSEWRSLVDPAPRGAAFTPARTIDFKFERNTKFFRQQNSKLILARDTDDRARLFNLATGRQVGERMAFDRRQEVVAIDDATERIAYVPREGGKDKSVKVRQMRDESSETLNIEDFGDVVGLFFTPHGLVVVQQHYQQYMVRLFAPGKTKPEYQTEVLALNGNEENANHVDLSPGGSYLAVQSHRGIALVNIKTGAIDARLAQPFYGDPQANETNNNCVRFSPDGQYLAARYMFGQVQTGGNVDKLCIWNLASGECLVDRSYALSLRIRGKADRSDNNTIAWMGNEMILAHGSLLLDRQTGSPFFLLAQDEEESVGPVTDNLILAFDEDEETLGVLPLPREKLVSALQTARKAVSENLPKLTTRAALPMPPLREPPSEAGSLLSVDAASSLAGKLGPVELPIAQGQPRKIWISPAELGWAVIQRDQRNNQHEHAIGSLEAARALPLSPEQLSNIAVHDLATGKPLHRLELPGRTVLLDVSPDGSLILTGNDYSKFGDFSRLDIWGPKLGKDHILGWQPTPSEPARTDLIADAKFIDKKHVLVWTRQEVSLWRLPACEQLYRVACPRQPRFSPTRRYWINDRVVHDSLTGEAAVKLETPASENGILSEVSFRPGGDELAGLWVFARSTTVLRWSLDGKLQGKLPLPVAQPGRCWPLGDRGLMVEQHLGAQRGFITVDLLRNQVAAIHGAGTDDNLHLPQADGTYWRCELIASGPDPARPNKAAYYLQGFTDSAFQWPAGGLDKLFVAEPGTKVSARVIGDVPDANLVGQALVDRLTAAGFVYDPAAEVALTFELKQIIPAEERLRVLRIFTPILSITGKDGTVYWLNSQRMEQPIELRQQFDAAGFIKARTPPQYVFNRPWKNEYDKTDLPPITVK